MYVNPVSKVHCVRVACRLRDVFEQLRHTTVDTKIYLAQYQIFADRVIGGRSDSWEPWLRSP